MNPVDYFDEDDTKRRHFTVANSFSLTLNVCCPNCKTTQDIRSENLYSDLIEEAHGSREVILTEIHCYNCKEKITVRLI